MIIIYIIFYRKFDQFFLEIFNGQERTSREQYNIWCPTDIIQVNEMSLKLFQLKNNLNRYLMFLFITSFIDIIIFTLNVFSMCLIFYFKGDNWVNTCIFLSIMIVLIFWVFFLMIFIRKLIRERNKRASNLDIIGGIRKLRTNNCHFSLYQTELTSLTIECVQMKFINFAK